MDMNRMSTSIGMSVLGPEGLELRRQGTQRIPIHFLREHVPKAISRFASPSCPWPWAGDSEADEAQARQHGSRPPSRYPSRTSSPTRPPDGPKLLFRTSNWDEYPHRFFPNWVSTVQDRCGMTTLFQAVDAPLCRIYPVELGMDNKFRQGKTVEDHTSMVDPLRPTNTFAQFLNCQRDVNTQLRCLCVENLSGNVLKMLGAHYRIEPFFFSSAINYIPSRYHEDLPEQHGDHMYITLPFLRVTKQRSAAGFETPDITASASDEDAINIFAPLELVGADKTLKVTLQQDMLAVLVVRAEGNHTLITVHPGPVPHSARTLAHRLMAAGQGVYWGNLISRTQDPVFLLLIVMWSAIYAWDEAMSALYTHVTHLETRVLKSGLKDVEAVSPQVHAVRAQLLWYEDLLDHFTKSLDFINKAGPMKSLEAETQEMTKVLLKKEIRILLNEVDRLHHQQKMLDERLNHVMKLVVSILNIKETQASLRHSESMKQITYLTTIYLPASFIATVFGMNIVEINPGSNGDLKTYIAIMIPLTVVTVWLAGFMTVRVDDPNTSFLRLVFWPTFLFLKHADIVWTWIRTLYFTQREHAWSPSDTLNAMDKPLPKPRVMPGARSRDPSRPRTQLFEGHANGYILPTSSLPASSRPNSTFIQPGRKADPAVRWTESRPHSVSSSRQSWHSIIDVERTARSPDAKPLASNYEHKPTTAPILMQTPPSDPAIPTRSSLGRGYARGESVGRARGGPGMEVTASAPGLLRPTFTDRNFASRSEVGKSEYAPSDISTRPPTPV